jgi:drug/metabolite transporter (DMT)-like permease
MTEARVTPRLQILLTAALFSTGGAAIKATSLAGWQVASFRSGVAALAILIMVPAARVRWSRRTVMVGGAYAATMILFVLGNKLTTAASTIYLQSTAPLYTLLLGPWLLKERIRRQDLLFMVALATGLGLFFVGVEEPQASAPNPLLGNLLGILTGIFWSLTVVGLRSLGKGSDPGGGSAASAVVAGNTLAFLVALPLALPVESATGADWGLIAFLGVVQIGVAYAMLTAALRHVPAMEATLLLLVEPVLSPLWAWIFHAELPSGWSFAACAVILVATTVRTWSAVRRFSSAR